jgi:hypothetical protein
MRLQLGCWFSILPGLLAMVLSGCSTVEKSTPEPAAVQVQPSPAELEQYYQKGLASDNRRDYTAAAQWYRKAADQGYAKAQYNLGAAYAQGQGVPKNLQEAVKWYRKAADQGYARAQYNLGIAYAHGLGVNQDYQEAAGWYRKAAEQGFAKAQYSLGVMYRRGQGVAPDPVMAYVWLSLSAAQGYKDAQPAQRAAAKSLTAAQRKSADQQVQEYSQRMSSQRPCSSCGVPAAG